MATAGEQLTTMAQVDGVFQQLACLGHGGFGSVFLAKKKSGRKMALKFMRIGLDDDEDEIHASFTREVDAVLKLDCTTSNEGNQDMSIVYFRDWFRGPNFACIVMQYCSGGTLSMEIDKKVQSNTPYTERRIVWYALQLSEALAHAHSHGVAHHDVKGSNVLIDAAAGGKLLLADFGSAVSPGEEGQTFTKLYAAPELLTAQESDDFSGLEPEKIDAFSLGCILFELVCCKRLVDFEGHSTLGQYVGQQHNAEAALNLPQIKLPWNPAREIGAPPLTDQVGYSYELGHLIKCLLEPVPSNRSVPADLQKPLRQGERSPLLADFCSAAVPPQPGAALTIDNINLGMFVQRGRDWNDGEADGGVGSVGVVVRLDPDAQYTEVSFPSRTNTDPKPITCRIGAGNKFELQVGPTPINDFYAGSPDPKAGGILYSRDSSQYHVGQMVNNNCMVVSVDRNGSFMVAPMEKIHVPTLPIEQPSGQDPVCAPSSRRPMPIPITWNTDLGLLVPLETGEERQMVLDSFFSPAGGMDIQLHEIVCIQAVQSEPMWEAFARCSEDVAQTNWSHPNHKRLFHGTGEHAPEALLGTAEGLYQACARVAGTGEILFSSAASFGDRFCHKSADGTMKKVILSRVALGRIDERREEEISPYRLECHSVNKTSGRGGTVFAIRNPFQAYPEFIITYKTLQRPGRRLVRARRPSGNRVRRVPARPIQTPSPRAANSPTETNFVFSPATGRIPGSNSPNLWPPSVPFVASSPPATSAAANTRPAVPFAASSPPKNQATGTATATITTPGGTTRTKQCVVCWERPVCKLLVPCGHPCLCEVCSTEQGLKKLKRKCPECRQPIKQAVKFYGTVVEDL